MYPEYLSETALFSTPCFTHTDLHVFTRPMWFVVLFSGINGLDGGRRCCSSLTIFFCNYGPNSTTFMLPALTYRDEVRACLNGISGGTGECWGNTEGEGGGVFRQHFRS